MPTWGIVLICVGGVFVFLVLLAIAIPTFLGVKDSANDRVAQSNLNTALTNGRAIYADNGNNFTGVSLTSLQQSMPFFNVVGPTTPVTSENTISVGVAPQAIVFTARSTTGHCWYVLYVAEASSALNPRLPQAPGVYYGTTDSSVCESAELPQHWSTDMFPQP